MTDFKTYKVLALESRFFCQFRLENLKINLTCSDWVQKSQFSATTSSRSYGDLNEWASGSGQQMIGEAVRGLRVGSRVTFVTSRLYAIIIYQE